MHDCPPPLDLLQAWLTSIAAVNGSYGHLLLEHNPACAADLVDGLRPYFESAHRDAKEYFDQFVGPSLHPDAAAAPPRPVYPNCLPSTARRGLFGEVMAGLITEAYQQSYVGQHPWRVPVFLFRKHADAEQFIWDLAQNPGLKRELLGRHGTDFVGICIGQDGSISRIIAGEAKWRKVLTPGRVTTLLLGEYLPKADGQDRERNNKGIWRNLNRDVPMPHGLRQLQIVLRERDPDANAALIYALDQILLHGQNPTPKTNLIFIIGDTAAQHVAGQSIIPSGAQPVEYEANHDLQVVEVHLVNGKELIADLYDGIWQGQP